MPDLANALTSLGQWIGLLSSNGTVQWVWLADPLKNTLSGMQSNRDQLGPLFAALLDKPTPAAVSFDTTHAWQPTAVGSIQTGFIWDTLPSGQTTGPLHIGLAATLPAPAEGGLALSLVLDLLAITNTVQSELGQLHFKAETPIKSIALLKKVSLEANYQGSFSLDLGVVNSVNNADTELHLKLPTPVLPWDVSRMAAFLVRSWVAVKDTGTPGNQDFWYRMDRHLFPMLGDPADTIKPLPPLDRASMGKAPDFGAWSGSVLSTSSSSGAITFLWHLRAFLTGNEDPSLYGGSTYLPVLAPPAGAPVSGGNPPSTAATIASYVSMVQAHASGVWVGIREGQGGSTELVLDFRSGGATEVVETVILARKSGGTFERPAFQAQNAAKLLNTLKTAAAANSGMTVTGPEADGSLVVIAYTRAVAKGDLQLQDGQYTFSLLIKAGQPVRYRVETPFVSVTLPPDASAVADLAISQALWGLDMLAQAAGANPPMAQALQVFRTMLPVLIKSGVPSASDALGLLKALLAGAGVGGQLQLAKGFSVSPTAQGIDVDVTLGPFKPADLGGLALGVDQVDLHAGLVFGAGGKVIDGASLQMKGLRLPQISGGSGLVAQLLPDMNSVPGFLLAVGWDGSSVSVSGGGTVPVQRKIGPVDVSQLLVKVEKQSLSLGVDLALGIGPVRVAAFGLQANVPYAQGNPSFSLQGLALSFDGGGIRMSGMFVAAPGATGTDYVGQAVVSVMDRFQLSAIGGYSQIKPGEASLFLFASLVAPLGGPPWFFITGIAGGFGFKRLLPSPTLLADHPFLKVMRGEIAFDPNNPSASLASLAGNFAPDARSNWIAAGIQFTCFGVINGKVIAVVQFGKSFSFQLLGMLSYGISRVAYFEIDFAMTADQDHFLLIGGMSPNSYLLDPSIFSLQGQFAMGVWYGGEHAGDFLVSVGGYHPAFRKPGHYPDLTRVGVKAVVSGFVHVDVQCFFACTPQALMAGASISLYAKFGGISAGLDVYVDVLIHWDPFMLQARLGVVVWFRFCGRHEVHVTLDIWTPEFGGKASIDLWLVSFDVSFGSSRKKLPPLKVFELLQKQLGVPAGALGNGASVAALSTASSNGLFRIDVTSGRTSKASGGTEQEGVSAPVEVNPEFAFTVTTRLPFDDSDTDKPNPSSLLNGVFRLAGHVNLPLCGSTLMEMPISLSISAAGIEKAQMTRMYDLYPAALFGDRLPDAGGDTSATDIVNSIDPSKPSCALFQGMAVSYGAVQDPPTVGTVTAKEEHSVGNEIMPLPLSWKKPQPQTHVVPRSYLSFADKAFQTKVKPQGASKTAQQIATEMASARPKRPFKVTATRGEISRRVSTVLARTLTVKAPPGVVVSNVPVSPVRRAELASVTLRIAPVVAPVTVGRVRLPVLTRAGSLLRNDIDLQVLPQRNAALFATAQIPATPATAAETTVSLGNVPRRLDPVGPIAIPQPLPRPIPIPVPRPIPIPRPLPRPLPVFLPDLVLAPTTAGHLLLDGGSPSAIHRFSTTGDAVLRAIFFAAGSRLLEDRFISGTVTNAEAPVGTREMLFLHAGTLSPVLAPPRFAAVFRGGLRVAENVGIDSDTAVVVQGARCFAAHACVVQSDLPLPFAASPMDTLSGEALLQGLSQFTVFFPAAGTSLVLMLQPVADDPGSPFEQVRWAATGANLSNLQTVVSSSDSALVMALDAAGAWSLDIDLGPDWRVSAVVLSGATVDSLVDRLNGSADWDLIDDRIQTGDKPPSISVTYGGQA